MLLDSIRHDLLMHKCYLSKFRYTSHQRIKLDGKLHEKVLLVHCEYSIRQYSEYMQYHCPSLSVILIEIFAMPILML